MKYTAFNADNILRPHAVVTPRSISFPLYFNLNLDNEWFYEGRDLYQKPRNAHDTNVRRYRLPKNAVISPADADWMPAVITMNSKSPDSLRIYARKGVPVDAS